MIGNDVIDLAKAAKESNWRRPGYLEKVFRNHEQKMILESGNPDSMVWLLFSMKEAAYKAHARETGIRAYMPFKLVCSDVKFGDNNISAIVNCEGIEYFTLSVVKKYFVHTSAAINRNILGKLKVIIKNTSIASFDDFISLELKQKRNLQIIKSRTGVPDLFDVRRNTLTPVSISHHGRYYGIISLGNL